MRVRFGCCLPWDAFLQKQTAASIYECLYIYAIGVANTETGPFPSDSVLRRERQQPLRALEGDVVLGAYHHHRVIACDGAEHAVDGLLVDDARHILGRARRRVDDDQVLGRRDRCDQAAEHAGHLLLGLGPDAAADRLPERTVADRIGDAAVGQSRLHRVDLVQISAERRLRNLDALLGEQIRQLRLGRDDVLEQHLDVGFCITFEYFA